MILIEGLETLSEPFPRSTVAIGTFDGIHVGHQAIIRHAVADARAFSRPALVFTFDRHPSEILAPERNPGYLTTPRQRARLVEELGADALIIARFDHTLSELSPDEFLLTILKSRLGAESIVVGTNFAFGKNRAGDLPYLVQAQSRFEYTLHPLEAVTVGSAPASSTRVREALRSGEIAEAEAVLGHPYWLAGTVVTGQQLGRHLGYPTANLALACPQVVPEDGIYAVKVHLDDGRILEGACSIGNRPTVEGAGRSIETYLFDFEEDIYGRSLEIRFIARLRGEEKFDSLEALVKQMERDVQSARQILKASRGQA